MKHLRALSIALLPFAALAATAPALADGADFPMDRGNFVRAMLDNHNAERQRLGLPLLVWDDRLASDAAVWARTMAETGEFEHDEESDAAEQQGENLWMGTRGAYSLAEMVDGWVEEKKYYARGAVFPHVSRTGNYEDVGHYTQLIWKDTRHVGCGLRADADYEYLVCRYDPPGNWEGEIAEHGRRGNGTKLASRD